jgi:hypothetical protein
MVPPLVVKGSPVTRPKSPPVAVILSSPLRALAVPVLMISAVPTRGTISAWCVNVRLESSIAIRRPRNKEKKKEKL